MKSKLEQYSEWMKTFENKIVSFSDSIWNDNVETVLYKGFKPFHDGLSLKEDCNYLTIRCGLTGIYTCINTWFHGKWMAECLDGSRTIAYRELKDYEEFKYDGDDEEITN